MYFTTLQYFHLRALKEWYLRAHSIEMYTEMVSIFFCYVWIILRYICDERKWAWCNFKNGQISDSISSLAEWIISGSKHIFSQIRCVELYLYVVHFRSCCTVRIDTLHSRLHVDGSSITHDQWTVCIRRRSPGAATERQQTVGGRRRRGRNGQISVPVSSAGARCSMPHLYTVFQKKHPLILLAISWGIVVRF